MKENKPMKDSLVKKSSNKKSSNDLISQRRCNAVERLVEASGARRNDEQNLGFSPRDFILCGLPYKRFPGAVYERKNGGFSFKIIADPRIGIPFGQDRLLPIWLATAFKASGEPRDRVIIFRCLKDISSALGLDDRGGKAARRIVERIRRVFGATYSLEGELWNGNHGERYHLIDKYELHFDRKVKPNQYSLWMNYIKLSEAFVESLKNGAIPVDFNSVTALKERHMALDLYIWEAWRSYRLAAGSCPDTFVPIFGPNGLALQLGTVAGTKKKIRELIKRAHRSVKSVWPECPNEIVGDTVMVRPGRAVNPHNKLHLEGVSGGPLKRVSFGLPSMLPSNDDHPDWLIFSGER